MKHKLAALIALFALLTAAWSGAASAAAATTEVTVTFKDVGGTFWAKDEITSLAKIGVIGGYPDKTFKPNASVTREEFAVLIAKAFYLDLPSSTQAASFADVANSRWSFAAIEASKEFLTGYYTPSGKSFFDPTSNATREDVAVALVKTLHYQPDDLQDRHILDRFYDADDISPNVRDYMALAVEKKLITGYSNGTLRPNKGVTRAESAALLYRVIKGASGDSQESLVLNVSAPDTTSSPTFYVTGDVTKGASVTINDKAVEVVQGQFRVGYQLEQEGTYTYTIVARLPGGKTQTVTKTIKFEKGAPLLTVTGVPESTDQQTIKVSWTVKDDNDPYPEVKVNGESQGSYSSSVNLDLQEGDNTITVTATNQAGKTAEVVKHVIFQSGGPVLKVGTLPATTDVDLITVSWTVSDANDTDPKVYVNGQQAYGSNTKVSLTPGDNVITVRAVNKLGKIAESSQTVKFASGGPTLKVAAIPATTGKSRVTVSWTVSDKNDSYPKVYVNGQEAYGSSAYIDLKAGTNTITFKATNSLSQSVEESHDIVFDPAAPTLTLGYAPETTSADSFTLTWTVSDDNDSYPKVYVNDELVYSSSVKVDLAQGANTFKIVASNSYGKTTVSTVTITRT